ncbi:helix-turn-helix domain-containing protein [Rhodovastum atsumiense]
MIQRLLFRYGLSKGRPIWTSNVQRESGAEWTLQEVAARLGIHQRTVYRWLRQRPAAQPHGHPGRSARLARADDRNRA